jgi:hypothetical protein
VERCLACEADSVGNRRVRPQLRSPQMRTALNIR